MNPPIKRRNFTQVKENDFFKVTFKKSEIRNRIEVLSESDNAYLRKRSYVQLLNRWCVLHTEGEWVSIEKDIMKDDEKQWIYRTYDTLINYYFEKETDAMAFKLIWE